MPVSVFERYEDLCDSPVMLSENVLNQLIGEGLVEKFGINEPILRCETVFMIQNGLIVDIPNPRDLLINPDADIVNSRRIFVPVYLDADLHYVLYVADKEKGEIAYYDSLYRNRVRGGKKVVETVHQAIELATGIDVSSYSFVGKTACSQQQNGYDCGLFVSEFIRCLSEGRVPVLDEINMWNVRLNWFKYLTTTRDKNGRKVNRAVGEWAVPSENATVEYIHRSETELQRAELDCLKGSNWLTGLIIDSFIEASISKFSVKERVILIPTVVSSLSLAKMQKPNVTNMIRGIKGNWVKALVPVNVNGNHWILGEFLRGRLRSGGDSKIVVYDSMKNDLDEITREKLKNVSQAILSMSGAVGIDEMSSRNYSNTQNDGFNCGVHVCFIAERICKKLQEPDHDVRKMLDYFPVGVYRGHIYNTLEQFFTIVENELNVSSASNSSEHSNESDAKDSTARNSTPPSKEQTDDTANSSAEDSITNALQQTELKKARERYRYSLKTLPQVERKEKMKEWNKEHGPKTPIRQRTAEYAEYDRQRKVIGRSDFISEDDKRALREQILTEMRAKRQQPRAAVCHPLPEPHLLNDIIFCKHCGALKFREETRKTICCSGGKVNIDDFDTRTPACMKPFRRRDDKKYTHRKELLRMYNSMLSFAVASYKPRDNVPRGGPPVFVIQGEMSFNLCHLLPGTTKTPKFSQLYVVDDGEAAKALKEAFKNNNAEHKSFKDLRYLYQVIKDNHPAAQALSMMYEKYLEAIEKHGDQLESKFKVIMSLKHKRDVPNANAIEDKDVHRGRLNVPVATNQVATVYMSETGAVDFKEMDYGTMIFDHHTGKPRPVRYFDPNRFALAFPLLLPDGRQTPGYGKQYFLKNSEEKTVEEPQDDDDPVVIDEEEDEKMEEFEEAQKKRTFVSRAEFFRFVMNYFPTEKEKKKYEQLKLQAAKNPNVDVFEPLRECIGDHWLWGQNRLSQAAAIDMFQTTDAERMEYFGKHFAEYRSEKQSVLWHVVEKQLPEGEKLGKVVHLPKVYPGSREYCTAKFQDGLAVAAVEGKPDLFVTMTGNPQWPEVMSLIPKKDDPFDHIALVDRIFMLKLSAMLDDITKKHIFGEVRAMILSIEFQKRGVPHAHILITLRQKITSSEHVRSFICAEIPQKPEKVDPQFASKQRYYDLVKKNMIHGPCEGRNDLGCRETDESGFSHCSKGYPMPYSEDFYIANDRVEYQRRDDGRIIKFGNGRVATNRYVVPHNPFLLVKYGCHINVEVCISPLALAYIYKYLFKGYDKQYIEFKTIIQGEINAGERQPEDQSQFCYDERSEFKSMRYLSAHEATYRILAFPLAKSTHIVRRVAVHMPGDKRMLFKANEDPNTVLASAKKTFQESYFELMSRDPTARHLSIQDVMKEYTLDRKRQFNKRKRATGKPVVIRLNPVVPSDMQRYALRTLLLHTPGATSYEHLKTVAEGTRTTVYETFLEAAKARMLINDEAEWDACLEEASHFKLPKQMRYLFAMILVNCAPTNPKGHWERHKAKMISPNPKRKRGASVEEREKRALAHIEKYLRQSGHTLKDFNFEPVDEELLVELDANEAVADTAEQAQRMEQYLNEQQREFSEMILNALKTPRNQDAKRCFFLQGSGGVGKTFTYNYLINKVTSIGMKVAACATTGIAATLLSRVNATTGWTGHSFFKLPLEVRDGRMTSSLSATGTKVEERRTRDLDLLIIDEAPMMRKEYYEGIDAYLRDIAKPQDQHLPFGGVVVILGGDFKQFMPVEKARNYAFDNAMRITLIYSKIWKHFSRFELTRNVRVDKDQQDFAEWLKKVGTGEINIEDETMQVPEKIYMENEDRLIEWIYPPEIRANPREMGKRALLAVRNEDVKILNEKVLELLPGEYKDLLSVDASQSHENEGFDALPVTEEFLNTLHPSGMPPHRLRLKVGMTVMLTRNLDVRRGLCNGVRLELLSMNSYMIHCRHITDAGTGDCMIPRFKFILSENNNALKFSRLQFPVVPAQCLTVNKSQGATLDRVGLVLRHPAFAHGTNYVAFSRVRNWESLRVTTNKIYPILGDGTRDIKIANPVAEDLLELAALDPSEIEEHL